METVFYQVTGYGYRLPVSDRHHGRLLQGKQHLVAHQATSTALKIQALHK
jgi:hypothetical protein